jgi:hypothetical protein
MKRVATHQTPGGEPGALGRTVPGDCLEGVLGAGRGESAARRQQGRDRKLITSNQGDEQPAGQADEVPHGSPGAQDRLAPREELGTETLEARGVSLPARPDDQIPRRLPRLKLLAPDLPQPPAQTIAGHRGRLELGDDQSHPWSARWVVHPDQVQVLKAMAPAMGEAAANIGRAREPVGSREARRWRQEPPCFDGSDTVSRFRPFLRRRERTARPQRVAIRARNPCLLTRRLFRGRYDGFIRGILPSEPGKLAGRAGEGQAEGQDGKVGKDGKDRR